MSGSRSYLDIMASRPPSTAVRRPLPHTSPSRTLFSNVRHDTTASSSAIADSPRRLLSYYLSKAAYNTDESGAAPTPQKETPNMQASNTQNKGSVLAPHDNGNAADTDSSTSVPSSAAKLLRPPPFSRSALSSEQRYPSASVRATQTPSPAQRPSFNFSGSADAPVAKASSTAAAVPVRNPFRSSSLRPAVEAGTAPPPQEDTEEEEQPISQPASPLQLSARPPPQGATPRGVSSSMTYDEEQQRQFEADVMSQVEALLQAQRSESYTELETYRVTAEEAQTTLRAVESALGEQLGPATAARFSAPPSHSPPLLPHATAQRQLPPLDVDTLALEMSRAAAAATPSATQRLLSAIMNIQDGQDVPSALHEVVRELYDELTRVLVPPVMNFMQTHQRGQESHRQQQHHSLQNSCRLVGETPVQDERLLQAQSEISALHEEVAALRRTLESRSVRRCVVRSSTDSANQEVAALHSSETMHHALLDRFFTECHAMLTRSRQESFALRRALEKERREHFVTRIRLLKPAPPSLPVQMNAAPSRAPVAARREESVSSPIVRSSTASQDGLAASADRPSEGGALDSSPAPSCFTPKEEYAKAAPHSWTPAQATVRLASNTEKRVEGDEGGASADYGDLDSDYDFKDGDASAHFVSSASGFEQVQRALPLRAAMRVAEEVLRTTSTSGEVNAMTGHPYYAHMNIAHSRRNPLIDSPATMKNANEDVAAPRRGGPHRVGGPSVRFSEPSLDDSYRSSKPALPGRGSNSAASDPLSDRESNTATSVNAAGVLSSSEHEKRVLSKAVELLRRYSVA
ncbi:hypothetical protein ABB37_01344 [Leptomonas pyrrhocoris]|uniref:Uncharacterized protein n=1 Tax=Leptomonas pyrrhocoris TaxID=157538 RepID=A0A0M9G8L0_LEPPY|nr:hypothetical protein ABB37_01344 [Leptomonas pyrrhocoris]XP_015663327.1 hypothetical protein ABB37_01344 [Leptomonas pyrrhocoris]KPA84887.1 hypothetical protein ABB37_01344 [Leptomonas pyrrhocoris]KPA84888.1 hypothetical protein ABB37_01344 [Leptomonas pyrrhocoris]|eukprot:XP_015663326.1 hypothetical protein ABB37_01344 [Leptomonas pyrrhocoris]